MTKVLVTEDYLGGIADGIRYANGGSATYKPPQMEDAIRALKKTLVEKSVTANGSYDPASDSADGYSAVTVNVPNSYAAGDEGKVVSNGALVAQTARASQITVNGTYDTTTNNSVTVNVSGGGTTPRLYLIHPDDMSAVLSGTYNYYKMYPACVGKIENNSTTSTWGLENVNFGGNTVTTLRRGGYACGGIILATRITAGLYSKLYADVMVSAYSSGWIQAHMALTAELAMSNAGRMKSAFKSIALVSDSMTSAEINAQSGVIINSTDPLLLSAQTVEVDISAITQDFYIGIWNSARNIYIRSLYVE